MGHPRGRARRFPVGLLWGDGATNLELLPKLILRALTALAAPLVVLAILSAIVTNEVKGRLGALMMVFYLINTLVAMLIGLTLTNLIRPGLGAALVESGSAAPALAKKTATELLMDLVPKSIGEPFTQNHLAQLVLLTLALGIGLVKIRDSQKARAKRRFEVVVDLLTIGFELLMKVLLWVVALVPLAVFGIVAASVGQKEGMARAWLVDLADRRRGRRACRSRSSGIWPRCRWWRGCRPVRFLRGSLNVMASTFSTASTAATIPITLKSLERLGISRRSSQLTACIGTNFNNDGTALYHGHGRALHGPVARLPVEHRRPGH